MSTNNLNKIYEKIEKLQSDLEIIKNFVIDMQSNERFNRVNQLPGVTGTFDGEFMITQDSQKIKVPENYAVKSRIVYGDTLKVVEDNGKKIFKQLLKLPRLKVFAVVSKKEGNYYALTEYGDHKISSTAVEYNNLKVGDHIQVRLPEENTKAPYAAFDKIINQENNEDTKVSNNVQKTNTKNNNYPSKKDFLPTKENTNLNNIANNKEIESYLTLDINNNKSNTNSNEIILSKGINYDKSNKDDQYSAIEPNENVNTQRATDKKNELDQKVKKDKINTKNNKNKSNKSDKSNSSYSVIQKNVDINDLPDYNKPQINSNDAYIELDDDLV